MTKRSLRRWFKLSVLASTALLALSARASLQGRNDDRQDRDRGRHEGDRDGRHDGDRDGRHDDDDEDNDRRERGGLMRLATGQFVTPTAIRDAVQQYLNPGLPAYMDFVAGEAVRSQLSPDGTTLAVLTAGQNSLYKPTARSMWPTRRSTSFSTTSSAPTKGNRS
jgi:hypothetical protein